MLRLYLYLNSRSSGHFRFKHGDRKRIADVLGITPQSVGYNLDRLRKRDWIGYNPQKDLYHIRGFRAIKRLENASRRQVVEVNVERELNDGKAFTALIWAAYIGNFIRVREREAERQQREECHKGGSKQKRGQRQAFFPVAVSVIAKCLGVSSSTACEGRKLAIQFGFLKAKEVFTPISQIEAELRYYEGGKAAAVVRRKHGRFFIQETLLLKIQNLHFCRMSRSKKSHPARSNEVAFSELDRVEITSTAINSVIPF